MRFDFYFNTAKYETLDGTLTVNEELVFFWYIRTLERRCSPYINRRFCLYEPDPHFFFAVELRKLEDIYYIKRIFEDVKRQIYKYKFISRVKLKENSTDLDNGDGFLNMLNAAMSYRLKFNDNSYEKLIHCILNCWGFSRRQEHLFYKAMAKKYNHRESR